MIILLLRKVSFPINKGGFILSIIYKLKVILHPSTCAFIHILPNILNWVPVTPISFGKALFGFSCFTIDFVIYLINLLCIKLTPAPESTIPYVCILSIFMGILGESASLAPISNTLQPLGLVLEPEHLGNL